MLTPLLTAQLHELARLINTAEGPRGGQHRPDQLDTAAALGRLLPDRQLSSASTQTLQQVRGLRTDLNALWDQIASGSRAAVQDHLNALIDSHGPVRLQLSAQATGQSTSAGPDDVTPAGARVAAEWVLGSSTAPAADRLAREMVMALAQAAVSGELHRLKVCAGTDCANALVDATRNQSKQFCDEANCANRTHVRAYRQRQSTGQEATPEKKTDPTPTEAAPKDAGKGPSSGISQKIRKLSAGLQDPELSKKDRKKLVKKFKKLRKELKGSADVKLLEKLAPDVKK